MDNKLLNKVITLSAKEEKLQGGKPVAKLKDENNLTYTVYRLKQDGTESVAWKQLQELILGDVVQIGYVEDYGEYEGKKVTYRTIRNFDRDIANGVQNAGGYQAPAPAQSPRREANRPQSGASVRDFDKEAVGKCQSLFLQAYIQSGHNFSEALLQVGQAKRLAENVVYGHTETVAPDIQESAEQMSQEDLNVEDIPF